MDSSLPIQLFCAAILAGAIGVYQNLLRRVVEGSGKVRTAEFDLPDLLVTIVLTGYLCLLVVLSFLQPSAPAGPMKPESVIPGALVLLLPSIGIAAFLYFRGISLRHLFGFDRISLLRALITALGLVTAALPLILATASLTQKLLNEAANEQELVQLFREVSAKSDHRSVAAIFFAGVVLAPIAEEFLFRGYFYGVLKRYCGGLISAVITAALFAAIHLNLSSLPSLVILALCLTIAYESTGCLLVPVGIHALFNLSQLSYMYWDTTQRHLP